MAAGPPYIAIIGARQASSGQAQAAEDIGRALAQAGAIVVCGGHGGVMAAACRGAASAGGLTIGILPGSDRASANEWVAVAIATGLGELRNGLIVRAADVVVAVGGAYGTLSELALALDAGVPVVGVDTWSIEGIESVSTPVEAVRRALELALGRCRPRGS
ncbi:MAG: TIGR00725 family protein [Solirubrobacteraceae bacterium]